MTNAEMFDLIMKRLGNRTSPTLRATVVQEINEKIRFLDQADEPAWFQEEIWTPSTVANQGYLDLPADYIRDNDEGEPEIYNGTVYDRIVKVGYNLLRKQTANATPAIPEGFALYGEKVYFGPTPDAVYLFRLPYFKRTEVVADNSSAISNKWAVNFFNFLTLSTIDIVARTHTRDMKVVQSISQELQVAADKMYKAIEARVHAGREYILDDEEN